MPYRFQPWLLALVLLLAVALLALIANAQAIAIIDTNPELADKASWKVVEGLTGECLVIEWKDGRSVYVRIKAINIIRLYPPGHEGGDPEDSVVELMVGSAMQRIVMPERMVNAVIEWEDSAPVAVFHKDGSVDDFRTTEN